MVTATKKLTPGQERVQLAHDVLDQIATKRFIAEHNVYVESMNGAWERNLIRIAKNQGSWHNPDFHGDNEGAPRDDKRFQVELEPPEACRVCVDGALFVAALDRHDDLKLRDLESPDSVDESDMSTYLDRWFTTFQTRLMELAFEGTWHGAANAKAMTGYGKNGNELHSAADRFYNYYTCWSDRGRGFDAEQLMVKIMENVISNRGTFRPDKDKKVMGWQEQNESLPTCLARVRSNRRDRGAVQRTKGR